MAKSGSAECAEGKAVDQQEASISTKRVFEGMVDVFRVGLVNLPGWDQRSDGAEAVMD